MAECGAARDDWLQRRHRRERRRGRATRSRTLALFPGSVGRAPHPWPAVAKDAAPRPLAAGHLPRQQGRQQGQARQQYLGLPADILRSADPEICAMRELKQRLADERRAARGFGEEPRTRKREAPMVSGLRKLRVLAENLLESQRYELDLRAFQGEPLTTEELRVQLRDQFGLRLTKPETAAIVEHLDEDKNGVIDYGEVMRQLLNPERLHPPAAELGDAEENDEDDTYEAFMARRAGKTVALAKAAAAPRRLRVPFVPCNPHHARELIRRQPGGV